jgi:CheY-like chemotaxis protein
MDVHMPGVDGFEATTAIREREKITGPKEWGCDGARYHRAAAVFKQELAA